MSDLKQFSRKIKVTANNVQFNADAVVRKTALAVAATVVLRTPVDTGRARANWQSRFGSPAADTLPTPNNATGAAAQAINQAQEVAARYKGGQPNSVIHITNNLPYIEALNNGSSTQAPKGFVKAAAQVAVSKIRGARIIK